MIGCPTRLVVVALICLFDTGNSQLTSRLAKALGGTLVRDKTASVIEPVAVPVTKLSPILRQRRELKVAAVAADKPRFIARLLTKQAAKVIDNVAFVFDASGSIRPANFVIAKDFAKYVIDLETEDDELNIKVAGLKFSTNAHPQFDFTTDPVLAKEEVDKIVYTNGPSTNLGKALLEAGKILKPQFGERIILMITDARHNDGADPVPIAESLRNAGIIIVVAAVGNADMALMESITGDPNLVIPTTFSALRLKPQSFLNIVNERVEATPLYLGPSAKRAAIVNSYAKSLGLTKDK